MSVDETSEQTMEVAGACHCGRITFRAKVNLSSVHVCHCTDCQSLTGSAFRVTAQASEEGFSLTSGNPNFYTKIGGSGAPRLQAFCSNCGSPLYATTPTGSNRIFGIRVGTLREKGQLTPKSEIWCRSKLAWLPDLAEEQRDNH